MGNVVLTSALITLTSTVAAEALPKDLGGRGELPSARLLIGTSLAFTGLSMADGFIPDIARPLSACVAVTALTYYGLPLIDNYFNNSHKTDARLRTSLTKKSESSDPTTFSNSTNRTGRTHRER